VKRNLLYWRRILSVWILPVLAIAPSLVWNQPGRAQEGERAGLIHASRSRQGMNSLADSESRLKPTEILTDSSLEKTSAMKQGFQPLSEYRFLAQSVPPSSRIRQGSQVSLNGRILPLSWTQQPANSTSADFRTWIADVGLMQSAGVDLLSSADSTKQPVQWFSVSLTGAQSLAARATGSYRYLDVTDFASLAGWQISADGNVLRITSPAANVSGIRQAEREWGSRIVVDLDRPAPWQVNFVDKPSPSPTPTPNPPDDPTKPAIPLQGLRAAPNLETPDDPTKPALPLQRRPLQQIIGQEWSIAIDAKVDPALLQDTFQTSKQLLSLKVEPAGDRTRVKVTIPLGWRPQVFSEGNPNRLVIDIRPDSLVEKNILWAPGVRWQQQYQNLGTARFPVVWLEVNPRQAGVKIRPILSNPPADQGTAPLLQTAEVSGVAAAINAGFFNRINRLALGAIRRDNKWLSGPILNRGAIAWNDGGEFAIDRLTLQETLITPANQFLRVSHLNSAYVQSGIGRYNSDWGTTYTPLSGNEIVVTVGGDHELSANPPEVRREQQLFPFQLTVIFWLCVRICRSPLNSPPALYCVWKLTLFLLILTVFPTFSAAGRCWYKTVELCWMRRRKGLAMRMFDRQQLEVRSGELLRGIC
jgi:hypothetical protein